MGQGVAGDRSGAVGPGGRALRNGPPASDTDLTPSPGPPARSLAVAAGCGAGHSDERATSWVGLTKRSAISRSTAIVPV